MKKNVGYKCSLLCGMFFLAMMTVMFSRNECIKASSAIKVRYFHKTVSFTGRQLSGTIDGKTISFGGTPGLSMKNRKNQKVYMVPAYYVFKKGLGAKYSYKNKKIKLSKWDINIEMLLNSKVCYVNGKKVILDHPPVMVKYMKTGRYKVLVPAKFVAKTFHYEYEYSHLSSHKTRIKMKTPFYIKYDGKWQHYTKTQADLFFDGGSVDVAEMPCIMINGIFYMKAKALVDPKIGASYNFDSFDGTISITYNGKKIEYRCDSPDVLVNDEELSMTVVPFLVYNAKMDEEYVMIPVEYTAKYLGLSYKGSIRKKICELQRKDRIYFEWEKDENREEQEFQGFGKLNEVKAERSRNMDIFTLSGTFSKDEVYIEKSSSEIKVYLFEIKKQIDDQEITLEFPYLYNRAKLEEEENNKIVFTLNRAETAGSSQIVIEENMVTVILSARQIQKEEEKIKIAVDCGHGSYTPGKRTPKLLCSLDFDKDGVIDAKAGSQIREHMPNTAVGNYAATALERCGFEVYRSAFGSEDIPLLERQANIKRAGCDYSISVHFNAAGNGRYFNNAEGIQGFIYKNASNQSKAMASAIMNQVKKGTKQVYRGVDARHVFAMCNNEAMKTKGSMLLECAFMTNWKELKTMVASESYWIETGEEIAEGFCEYLGVPYVSAK